MHLKGLDKLSIHSPISNVCSTFIMPCFSNLSIVLLPKESGIGIGDHCRLLPPSVVRRLVAGIFPEFGACGCERLGLEVHQL